MALSLKGNMKKIMLGTSDTWSTSHSSQRTSEPAYCIVDCQILRQYVCKATILDEFQNLLSACFQGYNSICTPPRMARISGLKS